MLHDFPSQTMAVGRLDEKSEGLLLLTTDGKFSAQITSRAIEKEYHVMVDGKATPKHIAQLKSGVDISVQGKIYTTKPCKASILTNTEHIIPRFVRDKRHGETSWLSITLTEGKFRQVRKMTAKIGLPTLRLVRVRIGSYTLGDLLPSEVRQIT